MNTFYPNVEEDIVPLNSRYTYPGKALKAKKVNARIQPASGQTFNPGQVIRLEFPDQGYVNPLNTTIRFDVTLFGARVTRAGINVDGGANTYDVSGSAKLRFQNSIQSIFNRVRIMYGSTPLEDLIDYNQIVRNLTEWSRSNQNNTIDQNSISRGIGGSAFSRFFGGTAGLVNVRQKYIQGLDGNVDNGNFYGYGNVPNSAGGVSCLSNQIGTWACTRTYQINLIGSGIFSQDKLIPLKFMASQLAIELTLERPEACIYQEGDFNSLSGTASGTGTAPLFASPVVPTYSVSNVVLGPEILEFDANYDSMFLKGLQSGGVPIKFSSWHTFKYGASGNSTCRLQINENAKSIKAMFCCQNKSPSDFQTDSHATIASSGTGGFMTNYQWKIGNTYYPPAPISGSLRSFSTVGNQGCKAFVELQRALNVLGNLELSTSINTIRWSQPVSTVTDLMGDYTLYNEFFNGTGIVTVSAAYSGATIPLASDMGAACYCAAINLETSHNVELLSGINSQEFGEIAFIGQWSNNQTNGYTLTVFSYFDAMLIFREGNVMELVQ
jgi:hypothetical protein